MMDIYLGGEKVGEATIVTSDETFETRGVSTRAMSGLIDLVRSYSTKTYYINPVALAELRAYWHERERQAARWPPRRDCRGNIRRRRPDRRRRFRSKEVPWRKQWRNPRPVA